MDIKYLTYFIQLCEDKNFSQAAQHLYITQQGLSLAIRNLEETIGLPLFVRNPKGVSLTSFGKELEPEARKMIHQWELFSNKVEFLKNNTAKTLPFSVASGTLSALSYEGIVDFQTKLPEIALIIKDLPDSLAESTLLTGEAEAILTIGQTDDVNIHSTLIATCQPMLIVPKNHPLAQKKQIDYPDLKNETLFIINEQFKIHHDFLNRCKQADVEPFIGLTTSDIRMIHTMVSQAQGIGLTIDFVLKDFQHTNVVSIPFSDKDFTWDIYFSTKYPQKTISLR